MSGIEELEALARELTGQHYLIRWLAQDDSSAYGECRGADFERLLLSDLVTKPSAAGVRTIDYARVSLTPKGYALAAHLRQLEALNDVPRPSPSGPHQRALDLAFSALRHVEDWQWGKREPGLRDDQYLSAETVRPMVAEAIAAIKALSPQHKAD